MAENTHNRERFVRRLQKAMDEHPDKPSLREVARRADLSPAYLSLLLSGERDIPSRDAINALEEVLNLPQGELFKAAGRPDDASLEFFRKEQAAPIMKTLALMPSSKLNEARTMLEKLLGSTSSKRK